MSVIKGKHDLRSLTLEERNVFVEEELRRLSREMTELREDEQLSQNKVSSILGLHSHGNLTLIEQGKNIPRLDRMLKILSVYGCTLNIVSLDD